MSGKGRGREAEARGALRAIPFGGTDAVPLDCSPADAAQLLGEPLAPFPPDRTGAEGPILLWDGLAIAFPDGEHCRQIDCGGTRSLSVGEIDVFAVSYRKALKALRRADPDIIVGRRWCTLPSWGIRLCAPADPGQGRRAGRATLYPAGAIAVEMEKVRVVARRVLPRRRERPLLAAKSWLEALRYGRWRLPRSSLQLVEEMLDLQQWAEAVECLMGAVAETGARLTDEEATLLRAVSEVIG